MEDDYFSKQEKPALTFIEDLFSLTQQNKGDLFFVLDDTIKPPTVKTGILESIDIDDTDKTFKIATVNFITPDEKKFYLRKFFMGDIDYFVYPVSLGGELFEKYKLYKIENSSDQIDDLLINLKNKTKDNSIKFNQNMEIINQIPKKSNKKESDNKILDKKKEDEEKKKLENDIKKEEEDKKKEERRKFLEEKKAKEAAIAEKARQKKAAWEEKQKQLLGLDNKNIVEQNKTDEGNFKHKYIKYKLKYVNLVNQLNEK